jgi:histone deacetylase 1/2
MLGFKKDVVYYFDEMIGTFHYAYAHPMKPLRVAMTDEIVRKYEMQKSFDSIDRDFAQLYNIHAKEETLTTFHSD